MNIDKLTDFSQNWVTYGQCKHFMLKAPHGFGLVLFYPLS